MINVNININHKDEFNALQQEEKLHVIETVKRVYEVVKGPA